jgi:ADP-dependent NAD(P)H-hydrate dehydratase
MTEIPGDGHRWTDEPLLRPPDARAGDSGAEASGSKVKAVDPLPSLPRRDSRGNKGTFGSVAVFGGCRTGATAMIGAPALAALGALRSGAGLAKLVMPKPIIDAGILMAPGATGIALATDAGGSIIAHEAAATFDAVVDQADALVVGPGLGQGEGVEALVLRAVQNDSLPLVLDADGLNVLARIAEFSLDFRARAILTPHPGEFARLARALAIEADPIEEGARPLAAELLSQRLGCIVVLKGAGTVVSDGHRTWTCDRGHACLGTGGTGDVLSGVIAGLCAQFARDAFAETMAARGLRGGGAPSKLSLFDLARIGVRAHALAGERWAMLHGAEAGLLATELADLIPGALEELRVQTPF